MNYSKPVSARRRKTAQQRHRLVTRFHHSQLTQRQFAARHGIGLSTLSKWLRRESKQSLPPVKFQEMTLPSVTPRWAVEVVSPQGWVIRLQNSTEVPTLPQLLLAVPC